MRDGTEAAVRAVVTALRRRGSARRAALMRAYFKRDEAVTFFGVVLPDLRALAREVWQERRATWDVRAATRFCDGLVRRPEFEAKAVGVLVLARWHREFPRRLFHDVRRWLAGGHCASWAAVDLVAPSLITVLVQRYPEVADDVSRWTGARSLWVRRAAVVTFVPLARRGQHLDTAYAVAEALFPDPHDLIHKAVGWMLREAGKADPRRLERFLLRHGPRIPRTTLRYAIERYSPARRQRLLRATRRSSRSD